MEKLTGHWLGFQGKRWFVVEKQDGSIVANSEDGFFTAADRETFVYWRRNHGWKRDAGRAALEASNE